MFYLELIRRWRREAVSPVHGNSGPNADRMVHGDFGASLKIPSGSEILLSDAGLEIAYDLENLRKTQVTGFSFLDAAI